MCYRSSGWIAVMILYLPVTKNHRYLIDKEKMIDQKMFNKLKPFEFLFRQTKKVYEENFDETV